jgi:hypothetical protein
VQQATKVLVAQSIPQKGVVQEGIFSTFRWKRDLAKAAEMSL